MAISGGILIFCAFLCLSCAVGRSNGGAVISHEGVSKADIRDFPYVVAMLDEDLDEFLGMGVLVSRNVVFCEEITVPIEELRLRVGSSQWSTGGVVVKPKEIIDYHYYSLIILEKEVEVSDSIKSIEFSDDPKQITVNTPVTMVGWGQTSRKSGKVANDLLLMSSESLSESACEHAYADLFDEVPDSISIFCLSHPPGHGVFDESESLAISGGLLQGFGVYREITDEMEHPALFVHVSIFVKKVRKTIRKYAMK